MVMTAAELRDLERPNIVAALRACNGKVFGDDGAPAMLDLKPTTLASRIKARSVQSPRRQLPVDRRT
jgi:hypothetical protein